MSASMLYAVALRCYNELHLSLGFKGLMEARLIKPVKVLYCHFLCKSFNFDSL
jgi:hypothetical protein